MNIFLLVTLVLLSFGVLAFRLLFIPASDYPDIGVVSSYFLSRLGLHSSSLSQVLDSTSSCVSQSIPASYILGASYSCDNILLDRAYLIYGLCIAALLVIPLWLITAFIPLDGGLGKHLRSVPLFIVILPSTFYYLVGIHSDVPYSIIGILSVYLLLCLSARTFIQKRVRRPFAQILISISGLLVAYLCTSVLLPDNQSLIVMLIVLSVYILTAIKVDRYRFLNGLVNVFEKQSRLLLQRRVTLVKSFIAVFFAFFSILFLLSISNIAIMEAMTGLPEPFGLVASHYSTVYVDVLAKYPLLLRLFGLFQTAVLRTPSYWGPSIVSWSWLVLTFLYGCVIMLSASRTKVPSSVKLAFLFFLLAIPVVVAVFPGYGNYKYFIALSPLLVLPLTYIPKTTFLAISLVYLDASLGFLWNN